MQVIEFIKSWLENRRKEYFENAELRAHLKRCELCNQKITDRTVVIYYELILALYEVYKYCGKNKIHEFNMKDIRHLLKRNEYARFGDLVRCGGLLYKPEPHKKGFFGLNMARTKEFFYGLRKIPLWFTLNQLTGEIIESHYVSIGEFPELKELLTKDGLYDPMPRVEAEKQTSLL